MDTHGIAAMSEFAQGTWSGDWLGLWLPVQWSFRKAGCAQVWGLLPPTPGLSDTSSHFLPAAASLSPAWPSQPDQPPLREHTAHTATPRVTASAMAVPTVSALAVPLSSRAPSPNPAGLSACLLRGPWPGHSGGSQPTAVCPPPPPGDSHWPHLPLLLSGHQSLTHPAYPFTDRRLGAPRP